MCQTTYPIPSVSIVRCQHGVCHVKLGHLTLHMTDNEIVLLAQTIHALAWRTPDLRAELDRAVAALPAMGYAPASDGGADAGANAGTDE